MGQVNLLVKSSSGCMSKPDSVSAIVECFRACQKQILEDQIKGKLF